jgi:hypothetical protein
MGAKVLAHLQILYTNILSRYRGVPTFGRGTIRRFHHNASAMKKLAARDFEDLLQVSSRTIDSSCITA